MAAPARLRLWIFLLFATFAVVSSARYTISVSGGIEYVDEAKVRLVGTERRSLRSVKLDDYGEASANKGHDPRNRASTGGGGRKTRDIP